MYKLFKFYLLRPFLTWLVIFAIFKSYFLIFHWNFVSEESLVHVLKVFTKAFSLDVSSTSYILIFSFFLMMLQYFIHDKFIKKIAMYYHLGILFSLSLINVVDIILFTYWSSKISLKAFQFIDRLDLVWQTIGAKSVFMGLLFLAFHFISGMKVLEKFNKKMSLSFKKSIFRFVFLILVSLGLLIVGIRGGLQQIPINQSVAYYSTNSTLNIAGVNPLWNFMNMIIQNKKYLNENPYVKMDKNLANEIVSDLFKVKIDTTIRLFNIEKPNIVYLMMEGVNANVFKTFSRKKSFAPNIDKLFSEGYLFTEFYSSGFRSDQGMLAVLGGFPPTPVSSITSQPEKFSKLPSFTKRLKQQDYNISYFMGGEPEFGNLKSFLISNAFDRLIDIKDFSKNQRTQNLGAPDEFLFKKFEDEMKTAKEPFFSLIFTGTTHEPYDMPFNEKVNNDRQKYLNTVSYLDSVMAVFLENVKQMSWYDNTIFVLMSDHAHSHPNNYSVDENERYHIPLLFFGKPLKEEFRNKKNNKICSQVDLPKTVLSQMNINNEDFIWSKNLMNPYNKEFAFYTYVEGSVLITDECNHGWEYRYDVARNYGSIGDSAMCVSKSQAFLQKLYDVYLSY